MPVLRRISNNQEMSRNLASVQCGGFTVNTAKISRRSLLGAGVTAAAVAANAPPALAAASQAGILKVGAGKAAIAIPASLLPLDGFTTVHDDLYVRVLLLQGGATELALVILDLTSISAEAIAGIRQVVT